MRFCPLCGSMLRTGDIDGAPRLHCSSEECPYVFWNNPVPVVAAVVELDGNVILIQNKGWPGHIFGLVSGFLEKGETAEDAILREISEELSLKGEQVHFIGLYPFFAMNQLIIAYHVEASGRIEVGKELADFRIVPPHRLRPWDFGTGPAVRDWLASRTTKQETNKETPTYDRI